MKNQVVLITGGSGRLGEVVVTNLLLEGARVVATFRSADSKISFEKRFNTYGDKFIALENNLLAEGSIQNLCQTIKELGLRPTALINAARNLEFLKVSFDGLTSRANFLAEFELDVAVPYELSMQLSLLEKSTLKSIINIGSQYGTVAANPHLYDHPNLDSPIQYSVAKAALAHLTKELAIRLSHKSIKVNCIAYGGIKGRVDTEFERRYEALCPSGKMLDLSEIFEPIKLLLSEGGSGINGHILAVDGGWTVW